MEQITFYKMSGSGNDFIIIDNRNQGVEKKKVSDFIKKVCCRKMSVGADGVVFVENADAVDFRWYFFNSDGSEAEMCGNAARCTARFAYLNGIAGRNMSFETGAGVIAALVTDDRVKIKMPAPTELKIDYSIHLKNGLLSVSSINTGVPHVIVAVDSINDTEVVKLGREIRFHEEFAPAGTNVNFICIQKDGTIAMRTYERGVEDETLACGTGAMAVSIVLARKFKKKSPMDIMTRSGNYLTIHFNENQGQFNDIFLEGDARVIYKGELWEDAWKYSNLT